LVASAGVFAASACVFAICASVFAVSACVPSFNCYYSELHVVDTCSPKDDNDKFLSANFICNPLPSDADLMMPPFALYLIIKLGFTKKSLKSNTF
jgi:hypothetical protein